MLGLTAEKPIFDEKLMEMSAEMDAFEGYGETHSRRIASLVDNLASAFTVESHDRLFLQQAALIHDIGEVQMARGYIRSSNILTTDQRIDLHRHPVIGEQAAAKLGLSRAVQLIVRWHHEWWNGTGYPDGLAADEIPLAARILRVADTYAALVSPRPYRQPLSAEAARRYMIEWAGIEFDPAVVKAFLAPVAAD